MAVGRIDTEADLQRFIEAVLEGRPAANRPELVTALPKRPVDGAEVLYRFTPTQTPSTTIPKLWHLRWDAKVSAWLPRATPPIVAQVGPAEAASMGINLWGTFNANDPRATAPLAGTYEVVTCDPEVYTATVPVGVWVGYTINGTHQVDPEAGTYIPAAAPNIPVGTLEARTEELALAAGDVARQDYYLLAGAPQVVTHRGRWLSIRPLKLT